jgi:hypothetical protein
MLPSDLGTGFVTLLKQLILVRFPYVLYRMFFCQGPNVFGLRPVVALFIAACLTLFGWNRVIEKIFNPFTQDDKVQKVLDFPRPEVAKITFHGNEHFHSIILRAIMVTKQRPEVIEEF